MNYFCIFSTKKKIKKHNMNRASTREREVGAATTTSSSTWTTATIMADGAEPGAAGTENDEFPAIGEGLC